MSPMIARNHAVIWFAIVRLVNIDRTPRVYEGLSQQKKHTEGHSVDISQGVALRRHVWKCGSGAEIDGRLGLANGSYEAIDNCPSTGFPPGSGLPSDNHTRVFPAEIYPLTCINSIMARSIGQIGSIDPNSENPSCHHPGHPKRQQPLSVPVRISFFFLNQHLYSATCNYDKDAVLTSPYG
jgi:hypothetical protein